MADSSVGESIVGGVEVPAGHVIIKSIVAVYDLEQGSLCTGSLLANNIVLTAAHCINPNPANMIIAFDIKLNGATSIIRPVDQAEVSSLWALGQEQEKNTGDIALIHFVGDVPTGYAPAVFVPSKASLKNGVPVIVAGFGISDGVSGEGAGTLRVAKVSIADADFSSSEIRLDQTQGQGSCHGDSGGPAYLYANGKFYLWGVTSRGYDDANNDCSRYSIYTNALSYATWIKNVSKKLVKASAAAALAHAN